MRPSAVIEQSQTALMQRFCSLGDNCELGMAQRFYGAEPSDLLRWAAIDAHALIALLRSGCAGLSDAGQYRASTVQDFHWVDHLGYGFGWHSLIRIGALPAAQVLQRELTRIPRLAQSLLADIGEAQRIFVLKRSAAALTSDEALAVWEAMQDYGDACLLFVTPADAAHPGGSVVWVAPGIMHGRIEGFADPVRVGQDTRADWWLALCQNAAALVDAQGKPGA